MPLKMIRTETRCPLGHRDLLACTRRCTGTVPPALVSGRPPRHSDCSKQLQVRLMRRGTLASHRSASARPSSGTSSMSLAAGSCRFDRWSARSLRSICKRSYGSSSGLGTMATANHPAPWTDRNLAISTGALGPARVSHDGLDVLICLSTMRQRRCLGNEACYLRWNGSDAR